MIRQWGFPIGLLAAWMLATAYTLSLALQGLQPPTQTQEPAPPAAIEEPAS